MTDILVTLLSSGAPVNSLAAAPEITIRRLDTGAAVVTSAAMTDVGSDGMYSYSYAATTPGLTYGYQIDSDPSATGQTDVRYFAGTFDEKLEWLWRDNGLDPANPKTITENVKGSDYDEDVGTMHKDSVKVGSVTTITRTT